MIHDTVAWMLNTRIKCCEIKKSEGRLFVPDKLIILFITKLNLFIDLLWKNKVIGIRKGHDKMYRSMYAQEPIVCHNNRIKATFYCLYVGIVRLWNFTSLNTGSVVECYFYSVL